MLKGTDTAATATVVFLHIPKAAGTTLGAIIARQYGDDGVYKIAGQSVQASIEQLLASPLEVKRSLRAVQGHLNFGIHHHLPKPTKYITLLRDPIERVVSDYYYVLQSPGHYCHNEVTSRGMSLEDYVSSGVTTEVDNCQVRRVSGFESTIAETPFDHGGIPFGRCTDEMLTRAKENLDSCFLFGLAERFEESLLLFRRELKWRIPFFVKRNVTRQRPSSSQLPNSSRRLIEERNRLDVEFYKFAAERFRERLCEVRRESNFFPTEVIAFKVLNRMYQQVAGRFSALRFT